MRNKWIQVVFKVKSHIDRHDERHEPERRADRARASIKLWVVEDRPVLEMAPDWKIELNEKMGDDPVEKKGPRCALADDAGGDHRVEEEITEEIILPKTNYLAIVLCQVGERRGRRGAGGGRTRAGRPRRGDRKRGVSLTPRTLMGERTWPCSPR